MIYTIKTGDTLNSIAEQYTIGGAAYGIALGNYNAVSSLANYPAGNTLEIPDSWLKPQYQAPETAGSSSSDSNYFNLTTPAPLPVAVPKTNFLGMSPTMLMIGGGALVLLALLGSR